MRKSRKGKGRGRQKASRWSTWLLLLLIVPGLCLFRASVEFALSREVILGVLLYCGILSLLTFWMYRADKRKAQNRHWRTPEARLHFFELIGGWPGAFVGQRVYRHKIVKGRYQLVFWMILLSYQAAGLDYLLRGPVTSYLRGFWE